jgi:SsrA-binding protein
MYFSVSKKKEADNSICRNRRAAFRFELLDRVECGLVLRGSEVKSLREGQATLEEAYATIEGDELWLIGMHIPPYVFDRSPDKPEPNRRRKLLARGREIRKLKPRVEQKGLTLVPVRAYFNDRGIAKIEIAVARGKAQADKRQSIRQREHRREMDQAVHRRR